MKLLKFGCEIEYNPNELSKICKFDVEEYLVKEVKSKFGLWHNVNETTKITETATKPINVNLENIVKLGEMLLKANFQRKQSGYYDKLAGGMHVHFSWDDRNEEDIYNLMYMLSYSKPKWFMKHERSKTFRDMAENISEYKYILPFYKKCKTLIEKWQVFHLNRYGGELRINENMFPLWLLYLPYLKNSERYVSIVEEMRKYFVENSEFSDIYVQEDYVTNRDFIDKYQGSMEDEIKVASKQLEKDFPRYKSVFQKYTRGSTISALKEAIKIMKEGE